MTWVIQMVYGIRGHVFTDTFTISGDYTPQQIQKRLETEITKQAEKEATFEFLELEVLTLDEWATKYDSSDIMEDKPAVVVEVVEKIEPLKLKEIVPADELDSLIEL